MAGDDRGGARRERELLPRARPPHEHQRQPGHLPGVRGPSRRLRARALRLLAGGTRGVGRHPDTAGRLLSPAASAIVAPRHARAARCAAARRVSLRGAGAHHARAHRAGLRARANDRTPSAAAPPAPPRARAPRVRDLSGGLHSGRARHVSRPAVARSHPGVEITTSPTPNLRARTRQSMATISGPETRSKCCLSTI